jgi:hypothetical protein
MILLADLIDRYSSDLEQCHGQQLLPGHHRALQAMRRCRNQHSRVMVLECNGCQHKVSLSHSCGHRSCPHCQHHESQQWLERQKAKLLAVDYFRENASSAPYRAESFSGCCSSTCCPAASGG